MPIRDEAETLEVAVGSVLAQEYPGEFEVVLAVGPSTDGTFEVAARLAQRNERVQVVENAEGSTSAGLNAGILVSRGEVIARVDGHAELEPGYLRRAVEILLDTGADNVGGIQLARGETPFERSVAAAMTSRFGVGDARFHYGGPPGPADTVYLGVFRRAALERVGGFDEDLVRNQDYELNWRIRDSGGVVYFHPDLRVRYRPRSSLRALARQYFEYGQFKRAVLRRHPRSLRWRHLVPPATVVTVVAAVVLAIVVSPWWFVVPAGYGAGVMLASAVSARRVGSMGAVRLLVIFPAMHWSWALGLIRGPGRRARRSRRTADPTSAS